MRSLRISLFTGISLVDRDVHSCEQERIEFTSFRVECDSGNCGGLGVEGCIFLTRDTVDTVPGGFPPVSCCLLPVCALLVEEIST